jgi:glutamate carboxypeptidase
VPGLREPPSRGPAPGGHYHSADEFAVLASITPRLYLATRLVMEASREPAR